MKRICVIGTGIMGKDIALVFATNKFEVIIKSVRGNELTAVEDIRCKVDKLYNKGKLSKEESEVIISRINPYRCDNDIEECDMVIEAISEDIEKKKGLFRYLGDVTKNDTILATNTSSLSISEIASVIKNPERVIGVHFFNPATIMNLVEVIRGLQTSDKVYNKVKEVIDKLNKTAVMVNEAPGFIVNRMLIPMINEAISILAEGVANAEDIDKAMMLGANHPMGPLALGDLIGLDICLDIMNTLYLETGDPKFRANSLLKKYVRVGWLGRKSKKGFYEY